MTASLINKYLQNIKPYKTSSHKIWDVSPNARRDILKLDWNEATVSPSPLVTKRLAALLKEPCFLNLYPNTANPRLMEMLVKYTGLPADNIQYFASSDVVHEYIARVYLCRGKSILIQSPAYDNFRLTAQSTGAKVYFSDIDAKTFTFDERKFERDLKQIKPDLVYICSPNNPVGYVTPNEYIEHLLRTYPNTLFLIDEAYIEFSTTPSAGVLVPKYENIIVTRTMSKAFAMANLRFGYVLSAAKNIQSMNSVRNPKNLPTFTQEAVIAALSDVKYMHNYARQVNAAKKYFIDAIRTMNGITAFDSAANFVLMKFDSYGHKANMFRWLKQHDIFVREVSQNPMLYKCLRITIGTREQMARVIKCMTDFYKQSPVTKSGRVALFDFCDTMVDFQTGNAFTQYVIAHANISLYKRIRYKIKHALNKKLNKLHLLGCCAGLSRERMSKLALDYYYEIVRPRLIRATMDKLRHYQTQGYKIYLVSGGFDMYLQYFADEFNIDGIFATRVQFKNDICTGKFDGPDCMGENKIKILQAFFGKNHIDGVAFSDSPTDLPLLKFVSRGYVVGPSVAACDWASRCNLGMLVYTPNEYYRD